MDLRPLGTDISDILFTTEKNLELTPTRKLTQLGMNPDPLSEREKWYYLPHNLFLIARCAVSVRLTSIFLYVWQMQQTLDKQGTKSNIDHVKLMAHCWYICQLTEKEENYICKECQGEDNTFLGTVLNLRSKNLNLYKVMEYISYKRMFIHK